MLKSPWQKFNIAAHLCHCSPGVISHQCSKGLAMIEDESSVPVRFLCIASKFPVSVVFNSTDMLLIIRFVPPLLGKIPSGDVWLLIRVAVHLITKRSQSGVHSLTIVWSNKLSSSTHLFICLFQFMIHSNKVSCCEFRVQVECNM